MPRELLVPLGYPAADARVPALRRKRPDELAVVLDEPPASPACPRRSSSLRRSTRR